MSNAQAEKGHSSAVVLKAGLWYTVCNFLLKGMAFITSPIFNRLLTKTELGDFSNITSWITILSVLTSFDLAQSIIRSKLEHGDDVDSYMWSILSFSTIWALICYGVVCLFPSFFVNLFQIEMKYIHVMFWYFLVTPAYSMLITKQRTFYKYKMFVLLTAVSMIMSLLLSLILVLVMEDKLAGRMYGFYLPCIVMYALIYVYIVVKGKKIKLKYWKYACVICLPLVPHELSLYMLSASDRILLKRICGAEIAAVYSVASNCYHISTILFSSMNKSFAPWLLECLHLEKYEDIRKTAKRYIGIFLALSVGLLLFVPELILIFGGKRYMEAVYCLPPLIASCVFQFVYAMYVNIEFYEKKTFGVAIATFIATALNIILNLIFIPLMKEQGFVVAAYTTLVGYMVLFILHFFIVKHMGLTHVYDTKFVLMCLGGFLGLSFVMNFFYQFYLIRYIVAGVYVAALGVFAYRNRKLLLSMLRKKKKPAPAAASAAGDAEQPDSAS